MSERTVAVINASIQLVPVNKNRSSINIFNRGANEVFISRDRITAVTQGYPVSVGGFATYLQNEGDDTKNAVYAFGAAGGSDVRINESYEPLPINELTRLLEARR